MLALEGMWYILDKNSKEELKKQIDDSQSLEESKDFLNKKLEKLSKNELTYKEQLFLENQIQEHEELKEVYDYYFEEKKLLWDKTKSSLNKLFEEYTDSVIWENNFEDIGNNLENGREKFDFFRDKVKQNIDIKTNIESLYETENIKHFIDQFTLEYINFLDKNYEKAYEFFKKNGFKNLLLDDKELNYILYNIVSDFIDKKSEFNNQIEFNIKGNKTTIINILDYRINIISKRNIEKQKEEIRKNKKEKLNLWLLLINWNFEDKDIKRIKSILSTDIEDYDDLKIKYIKDVLLKEQLITKERLLLLMENENKNFNYLDFLENFHLTNKVEKVALDLIESKWIEIKDKEVILNNLRSFLMFFIDMESDGYNVENFNNSWAEWYFQFKWNNGDFKSAYSSFETALRRTSKYYTNSFWIKKWNPDWVLKAWENRGEFTPIQLSAEEQTILFLCDIFNRNNSEVKAHLENILINWNQWSIKQLYKEEHHTNVVWNTHTRLESKMHTILEKYNYLSKIN